MSHDAYEIGNHDGRPIYFYEFVWGNSAWFYTAAERQLFIGTQAYDPAAISDNGLTVGGANPAQFEITCASNLPVVALYRGTPPSQNVRVTVLRKHADDPETKIVFTGKIDNVKRSGAKATILCTSGKQRRGGLRLTWSRTCPHVLYDSQCALNKADFALDAEVATVTGSGFTVTVEPHETVGWFDGGIVEWNADGLGTIERRAIERGVSTTEFLIFGRADGLEVGTAVTMYPGCDRLSTTCNEKFNNLVNYGGITQMPGVSPYGQNIF